MTTPAGEVSEVSEVGVVTTLPMLPCGVFVLSPQEASGLHELWGTFAPQPREGQ